MDAERINIFFFRIFCSFFGVLFTLVGAVLLYVAIEQWLRCYGDENIWIIFPSEILAPVGGIFLLFGLVLVFLAIRASSILGVRQ